MSQTSTVQSPDKLDVLFTGLKANCRMMKHTSAAERIERLLRLKSAIKSRRSDIVRALAKDLAKPEQDCLSEINSSLADIDFAVANLEQWMQPRVVEKSPGLGAVENKIHYEPKGVVLLFGAWNFPFALVIQPLVPIIAAGNVAIVKPNELASATSAVCAEIIAESCAPTEVVAVEGGVDLANELLKLPVDHIFFTGSPSVGRTVMAAASQHLASVTLELGGKNPVVVDQNADIEAAAAKIAYHRTINSGQVCLCPENIWIHESQRDRFIAAAKATIQAMYYKDGKFLVSAQSKIINDRNLQRIQGYLADAVGKGATLAFGGDAHPELQTMEPAILVDIPNEAIILDNEIFGPVLCVRTYQNIDEVYTRLDTEPTPLALYVFSENEDFVEEVLANSRSGGVTVNNCMLHAFEQNLPFGGAQSSGTGRYHGVYGFQELSNQRSILVSA